MQKSRELFTLLYIFKLACDSLTCSASLPRVRLSFYRPPLTSSLVMFNVLCFSTISHATPLSTKISLSPTLTPKSGNGSRRGRHCYLQLYYHSPMAINNKPLLLRVLMNGGRRALFIPVGHAIVRVPTTNVFTILIYPVTF